MRIKAYAKVNFGLKVYKGKIQSKHKIDSIFILYKKLYNTISIKKSKTLSIKYSYKKVRHPKYEERIIFDALIYLRDKYGWDIDYKIVINKRIPLGSGLGGSSSDAAAVINYILSKNNYVGLDLKEIALEVGSDIPFFLSHYTAARVKEFGNKVSPIYNFKPKFELHMNEFDCNTKEIFESLSSDDSYTSQVNIEKILTNSLYKQHLNVVYNDLSKYIILNNSQLGKLYNSFDNNSFFTGAGSTIVTIKE